MSLNMELKKTIDQISKDRGIDRATLIETLEEAVRSSVSKKFGDALDIEVNFNEDEGRIEVYQFKVVVEEVEDEQTEISLEDARQHDPGVTLEDEVGFKLEVKDLGRIAAQSAKQVIIQRMRDAEQKIIYEEYKNRTGEIISGNVQRRDRTGWVINLGRTDALLPREEQIPSEHFHRNDRVQGLIIDVRQEGRGPQIIISRSHPDYLKALFHQEVPEISDGIVQIMGAARDPGKRAKLAVISRENEVDPVGSCVGVRGSRIHNIVQELRGERVDIVVWHPDIASYAVNALSPARVSRIFIDEDEKTLEVIVPDDQLTPAIGKKGQNVKLASKLLGWRIDVLTESRYLEGNTNRQQMTQLASAAEIPIDSFTHAGFDSLESIAEAEPDSLMQIEGMTEEKMAALKAALNLLQMEKDTPDMGKEE